MGNYEDYVKRYNEVHDRKLFTGPAMSKNEYLEYFEDRPYTDFPEYFRELIHPTPNPWADTPKSDVKSYLVRKVATDRSEHELNAALATLLNSMAKDNYHPIKIQPSYSRTDYITSYTVIFYHMPNGPAFTPPF